MSRRKGRTGTKWSKKYTSLEAVTQGARAARDDERGERKGGRKKYRGDDAQKEERTEGGAEAVTASLQAATDGEKERWRETYVRHAAEGQEP